MKKAEKVERAAGGAAPDVEDADGAVAPGSVVFGAIVSRSPAMGEAIERLKRAAPYRATVLIHGESGTGKRAAARAMHACSDRSSRPLQTFDCASVPETLLEGRLFGHVRGAFTGATEDRAGVFEDADGGTLYVTGLSDVAESVQVKLLRVLQDGRVTRLGEGRERTVDVRLVVAAPTDLLERVREGRFRADLYYRLNVISVLLPALRARREDVRALAAAHLNSIGGASPRVLSASALSALMEHSWPGNVRELHHALERASILSTETELKGEDFAWLARRRKRSAGRAAEFSFEDEACGLSVPRWQERIERELIKRALRQTDGNRTQAAQLLEISLRSLHYKLKSYFPQGLGEPSGSAETVTDP